MKTFLWHALAVFVGWEKIYSIYLLPDRIIDRPLLMFVGNSTARFIGWIKNTNVATYKNITKTVFVDGNSQPSINPTIFLGPKRLIGIADGCNGLGFFVLFIGFIIVYPGKIYLKTIYSIVGIMFITFLNISRCLISKSLF